MRFSFKVALMTAITGLILLTVLAVGFTSYYNVRFVAKDLSNQIIEQTGERIEQEIQGIVRSAASQGTLVKNLISTGKLNPLNFYELRGFFLESMRSQPQLTFTSFALESNGEYCEIMRNRKGNLTSRFLKRIAGQLQLYDFKVKGTDFIPVPGGNDKPHDARNRPYYKAAVKAGTDVWTETYLFIGAGGFFYIPGVTRAIPVYSKTQNQLLGVASVDFDLYALSDFLAQLKIGKTGYAFVIEYRSDGRRVVIAHPDVKLLTRASPTTGNREAVPLNELADPRIPAFAVSLPESTGDVNAGEPFLFTAGDSDYFGSIRPLGGQSGLKWLIGSVIPEIDIMDRVYANMRTTLLVGAGLLVISIAVAVLLSLGISIPLFRLTRETERIKDFHLGPKAVRSRITEVDRLAGAVEEMKMGLRSFRKFVPAELVRSLIARGQEAEIGGSRLPLTIYFSDIAGFTSIAERIDPEELVELLGEYLEAMAGAIRRGGGTVDKFIGDAIMAFWGAPVPRTDHALACVKAALKNREDLIELQTRWGSAGREKLEARIGIHTGEAVVGNIGSRERLNYTAIGDSVNLASRLEGLNKYYGTDIIISEATYKEVAAEVVARKLDIVSVKGKAKGIAIYELVALKSGCDPKVYPAISDYNSGVASYLERDWQRAKELWQPLAETGDPAATLMLARLSEYEQSPPPPDWDGVYRMQSK